MTLFNSQKTEVVHQPAPGKPYGEPTITVNGQKRQVVDKFTYLGSTLSRAVHIDEEVTARTAKASVAFGRLRTLHVKWLEARNFGFRKERDCTIRVAKTRH